jgi:hypothetical protein
MQGSVLNGCVFFRWCSEPLQYPSDYWRLVNTLIRLVHRVISRRRTAVGQLADFQGGPSRTGGNDEHI